MSPQRGPGGRRRRREGRRTGQEREAQGRAKRREGSGSGGGLGESVRTIVVAVVLALGIRSFVFQTFYVPSGSMFPNLLVGDHVFVNKFLYGIRIPWTELRTPGLREPQRGDVVVFRAARTPEGRVAPADLRREAPTEDFIKRVVAVPGDVVELRGGRLHVNGEAVGRGRSEGEFVDPSGRRFQVEREGSGRCRYAILDDPKRPPMDLPGHRLEEGRYFVMGDNRDDSYDSRFFGSVRGQEIYGPAGLIYWSWDFTGSWLSLANPLTWWRNLSGRTRWGRIGDSVSCKGGDAG